MRAVQQPTASSRFKKGHPAENGVLSLCKKGAISIGLSLLPVWKFLTLLNVDLVIITTPLGLVREVALSLSFAYVNSDKGSFIAAILPMLLSICLAPIHCLSSRSLTSNTSREFIVYHVLQDCRPLGLCLVVKPMETDPDSSCRQGRHCLDVETRRSAAQGGTCGPCIVKADRNRRQDGEARRG
jgi:hypothetical protein